MKPHQLARRTDRKTSKAAARNERVHNSQRARVQRLYEADAATEDEPGLTADEVSELLGFDAWRRVSDLTGDDILVPLLDRHGDEVTRPTRMGKAATVMVLA